MKLPLAVLFILLAIMPVTAFGQWHEVYPPYYGHGTIIGPPIYISPPTYIGPPIYVDPPIVLPPPTYVAPPTLYWHNGYWYRSESTGWQWRWQSGHWSTSPYCTR